MRAFLAYNFSYIALSLSLALFLENVINENEFFVRAFDVRSRIQLSQWHRPRRRMKKIESEYFCFTCVALISLGNLFLSCVRVCVCVGFFHHCYWCCCCCCWWHYCCCCRSRSFSHSRHVFLKLLFINIHSMYVHNNTLVICLAQCLVKLFLFM